MLCVTRKKGYVMVHSIVVFYCRRLTVAYVYDSQESIGLLTIYSSLQGTMS